MNVLVIAPHPDDEILGGVPLQSILPRDTTYMSVSLQRAQRPCSARRLSAR